MIALYTIGSNQSPDTSVPDFVYGIMISLFIFFNIFAVNQWLQYRQIGSLAGLPLRGKGLYHPQPGGQVGAGVADVLRDDAAGISS